jgi:hypothetical protein
MTTKQKLTREEGTVGIVDHVLMSSELQKRVSFKEPSKVPQAMVTAVVTLNGETHYFARASFAPGTLGFEAPYNVAQAVLEHLALRSRAEFSIKFGESERLWTIISSDALYNIAVDDLGPTTGVRITVTQR